jgi:hypothetical protein
MSRPSFNSAWAAAQRIFDPRDPSARVAQVVGGAVARNINAPPPQNWKNTCAVRISFVLNETGLPVPALARKTVSGGDKRNYFYRVKDVIEFLHRRWGKPDSVLQYPPSNASALVGKRGLILFQVSGWGDASGHATLWNGSVCYDHCYFNEPGANYRTDRANFWRLP